jgi:hypothetical protein
LPNAAVLHLPVESGYYLYISQYVVEECVRGDPAAAQKRLDFIRGIESLGKSVEIDELAAIYQGLLQIPDKAKTDCYHLAMCVKAKIHYLLSWNCTHLGFASYQKVKKHNNNNGLWTPFLVKPDDLMEYKGGIMMTYAEDDPILELFRNREAVIKEYGGIEGWLKHIDDDRPRLEAEGWKFVSVEEVATRNHRQANAVQSALL